MVLWPRGNGSDNGGGTTVPPGGGDPPAVVVVPSEPVAPACPIIRSNTTKTEPAIIAPYLQNAVKWRVYTWTVDEHSCGITVSGRTAGGALVNRMEFGASQNFLYQFVVTSDNNGQRVIVTRYEPNGFFGGRTVYDANASQTKIERIRQVDERQRPTIDARFSYTSSGTFVQVELLTLSTNNGAVVSRQTLGPGPATDDVLKRYFYLYGEVAG